MAGTLCGGACRVFQAGFVRASVCALSSPGDCEAPGEANPPRAQLFDKFPSIDSRASSRDRGNHHVPAIAAADASRELSARPGRRARGAGAEAVAIVI
jgi:hypothetical protein